MIYSFILDDGWYKQDSPNTDVQFPALNVTNGSNLLLGVKSLQLPALSLTNSSNLTHLDATATQVYGLDISVGGAMSIDATSAVNVNGRGYLGGRRPGNSIDYGRTSGNVTTNGSSKRAGGSYGGTGGSGTGAIIGSSYGVLTDPTEPGGGGGGYNYYGDYPGGDGGGLIRLTVAGTLAVDGTISTDGSTPGSNGNGGGAGGGIYIHTVSISGSGVISANGGSAGTYTTSAKGGGGGGRIAVYSQSSSYLGTISADGGTGTYGGGTGEAGTLYSEPSAIDLSITIADALDPVFNGESIDYTLIVTNNSATDATGVILTDTIPAGALFQSTAPSQGSCTENGGVVTCDLGSIVAGGDATVLLQVLVADEWTQTNSATVIGNQLDLLPESNTAAETTVIDPADLAVTQSASAEPAIPGDPFSYAITVTNNGPLDADSVTLSNVLPDSIPTPEYSTDGGSTWDPWTGSVNLETLANGAVQEVQIRGTVDPAATEPITHTVSIESVRSDPDESNNTAVLGTTFLPRADLSIALTDDPDPVVPGTPLTYTFTIVNAGPSDATHVVLTDAVPAAVSGSAYSLDAGVTWTAWTGSIDIGTLVPGASREVHLRGTVLSETVTGIENSADVASVVADPETADNTTGTMATAVSPTADLSLTMTDAPDPAVADYDLTYEMNLTNLGPSDAVNTVLTDELPAPLENPVYSLDGGLTWSSYTGSLNLGTLVSSGAIKILLRGTILSGTEGTLSNSCSVSSDTYDPDTVNNAVSGVETVVEADPPAETIAADMVIDTLDFSHDGRHITVGDGATPVTLTVNGTHTFASLTIQPGAVVTHGQTDGASVYWMALLIEGDLNVMDGGAIDTNARGYLGGRRPGNASDYGRTVGNVTTGGSYDADGGSYGGLGGNGSNGGAICLTYGEVTDPADLGSGGGAWDSNHPGGDGGGLIRLTVGGALTNDGAISANGGTPGSGRLAGGGSGGGIYIQTGSLVGGGVISADGGNGGTYCCGHQMGGGGGGRIAILADSDLFTGLITAYGGSGTQGGPSGGAGTIFKKSAAQSHGDLMADNGGRIPIDSSTPLPAEPTVYENVRITGGARVFNTTVTQVTGTFILDNGWYKQDNPELTLQLPALNVTNNAQLLLGVGQVQLPSLSLTNGSTMQHLETTATQQYRLDVQVDGSMFVDATSRVDVDAHGYLGGRRPGNASDYGRTVGNVTTGGSYDADGGSYGGLGGNGSNGGAICSTYGEVTDPVDLGSGGGAWDSNHPGGDGGGLMRLTVGGALTNDGTISTNGGTPGSGKLAGGGSGGGIYIQTGSLVGGGVISADGGNGGSYCCVYQMGGGGGGRIAIYYTNHSYTGTLSAHGGNGTQGGPNGGAGTIFIKGPAHTYGELAVDNSERSAVEGSTPLPAAAIAFEKLTVSGSARVRTEALTWVGSLALDGAWLTLDCSGQRLTLGTLFLTNGANLTHPDTTTATTHLIDVTVTGDMTVDAASTINVAARGYLGGWRSGNSSDYGRTSGNVTTNGSREADGGSHGGFGGDGSSGPTGLSYGDLTDPVEPGGGGGAWTSNHPSGNGGGLVRLVVEGTFTHDGSIIADGGSPPAGNLAGGGAGGGISIQAGALTGTGNISSVGGTGGTYCCGYTEGGGGGGRIALHYDSSTFVGAVSAHGGAGNYGGGPGGAGTIYWKQIDQPDGDLVVENNGQTTGRISTRGLSVIYRGTSDAEGGIAGSVLTDTAAAWIPGALVGMIVNPDRRQNASFGITDNTETTLTTDGDLGIVAAGGASYAIGVGQFNSVSIGRSAFVGLDDLPLYADVVDLYDQATVSHEDAGTDSVSRLDIHATYLTIDETSRIDVSDQGYLGGYSGGNSSYYGRTTGNTNGSYKTSGGSHGNLGGTGYQTHPVGAAYGSDMAPGDLGGGGGAWDGGNPGGDGGGLVNLTVSGTLLLNGAISANGNSAGSGTLAGGGAGGGILVRAGRFEGSGAMTANGGNGGTHSYGSGGGGGGRLAYLYGASSYSGTTTALGGTGQNGGTDGGDGTVYTGEQQFADITITISDDPDPASVGGPLTYDITVTNNGPVDVTGVTVSDLLPPGVVFVSAGPSQGTCSGSETVSCDLGTLANGNSATVTVVVDPTTPGTIENSVGVAIDQIALDPMKITASTSTLVYASDAEADLSVSIVDGVDPITAGQSLTYTVIVTSSSVFDAQNVILTQVLSAQIQDPVYSLDGGGTWHNWTGTIHLGIVPAGESIEVRIRGTVHPSALGLLTTAAEVTSDTGDPNPANNDASEMTTASALADLLVDMSSTPHPVAAGEDLTSTVTLTNAGPSDALNVSLSADMPVQLDGQQYSLNNGDTWSSWTGALNIGTVAAGAKKIVLLRGAVQLGATGSLSYAATVSSDTSDPDTTFNSSGVVTTSITTRADLVVTLSDNPDPVTVGDPLTYQIAVTNNGPSNAANVSLTHVVPGSVTVVSTSPGQGTCSGTGPVNCDLGGVSRNGQLFITIVGTPQSTGTISATATVASGEPDADTANNAVTEETTVSSNSDLVVSQIDLSPPDSIRDGETVILTATVQNLNDYPSVNTFMVDFLLDGTSIGTQSVDDSLAGGASVQISREWTARPGAHSIEVVVDSAGNVVETDETNNSKQLDSLAVGWADFVIAGVTWAPENPVQGERVTFTATVANNGAATLRAFAVDFTIDGAGIGSVEIPGGLATGATTAVTQTWTAETGEHTVEVVADSAGQISESDESNNLLAQPLSSIAAADLAVSGIVYDPLQPADGQPVTLTATVENIASTTLKDFDVEFVVDGTAIGSHTVSGGLAGGASTQVSETWPALVGTHIVTVTADAARVVTESEEENNTGSVTLPLIAAPDLTISSITRTPATPSMGEMVTFTATISNTGGSTERKFEVGFAVDGEAIGIQAVATGLENNATTTVTHTWVATSGSHTVTVTVDPGDQMPETDDANNSLTENLPTILPPDLTVSEITWFPSSPTDGEEITFTATITNDGSGGLFGTFYTQFNVDGASIGTIPFTQPVASGASIQISQTWTATPGTHSITVNVDITQFVKEADETNNLLGQTMPPIGAVDLLISRIDWSPDPIVDGEFAEFTAVVENREAGRTSRTFAVEFRIDGQVIDRRTIFGIEADGQQSVSVPWTATAGQHQVEIVADVTSQITEADETNNILSQALPFVADAMAPTPPTVDPVSSPTNSAIQTLKGTKETEASIWINGFEVVPVDALTTWSYPVNLATGENNIEIYSKDANDNQSTSVFTLILYDSIPPDPVTPLTAIAAGDGTFVQLNWGGYNLTANEDVAFFRVYVSDQPYTTVEGLTAVSSPMVGSTAYMVQALTSGTIYYFAVVAVDRAGNAQSEVTPIAVAPVDTAAPSNVTNVQVESHADRLLFSWAHSPAGDLGGYRVYFDGAAEALVLAVDQASYEAAGLDPASVHTFRITAVDTQGNESSGVSVVAVTVLANPVDTSAEARSGYADLSWTAVEPVQYVKYYALYMSTVSFTSVEGMAPVEHVTGTSARISDLTNGETYYLAVTAVNTSGGESKQVSTVTASPIQRPEIVSVKGNYVSPVSAVNDFRLTLQFDSTMDTSVTPVIDIAGSGIDRPTVPAGGTWVSSRIPNDTYATPEIALAQGMDGTLQVDISGAKDAETNTMLAVSGVYTFTLDATPPITPAFSLLSTGCSSAMLSWAAYTPPPDLAGYQIYLERGSSFSEIGGRSPIGWTERGGLTLTITGLSFGSDYYAAVVAVDKVGNKFTDVSPVTFRLDQSIPPPITTTVESGADPGIAKVSWPVQDTASICGFAGYRLYYQDADFTSVSGLVPQAILGIGDQQITIEGLDRSKRYYFAVVGFNDAGDFDSAVSPTAWTDPYAGEIVQDTVIGAGTQKSIPVHQAIVVTNGATLTLATGTHLLFAPGTGITVESGRIIAEGTDLEPVVLTSQSDQPDGEPRPGDWNGLVLGDGAGASLLRHVIVRYASEVSIAGASPTLEAFSSLYSAGSGLLVKNGATVTTMEALIAYNQTGVRIEDTAQLSISQSVIKGNTVNAVSAGTLVLNASGNWWGSIDEASIISKLTGNVNYTNYLTDEPLLTPAVGIAGGETSVGTRNIELRLACRTADEMRISEDSAFTGIYFQAFSDRQVFELSEGGGAKTIFAEFRSVSGAVSIPVSIDINYITDGPVIHQFNLFEGQTLNRPFTVSAQATAALGLTAVEFYVDGEIQNQGAASPYSYRWDIRNVDNGVHRVKLVVQDSAGNLATTERNLVVDVTPPPAPAITDPGSGMVTASETLTVRGSTEPFITLQITRNGYVVANIGAASDGSFEVTGVTLTEGANTLLATARDDFGQSPSSNPVDVILDSGVPAAPLALEPHVRPWGGIEISWQFSESGERPVRFDLYRHDAYFTDPSEATLIKANLDRMDHIDNLAPDGTLYYGVVGLDAAGNLSELSNVVSAIYDLTSPGFAIEYDRPAPFGPDTISITVTTDEPLENAPALTILPYGTYVPKAVKLASVDTLTYTGTFTIEADTPSGTAAVNVSGKDAAGNSFYGKPEGADFVVDTDGPACIVAVDATPPVQLLTDQILTVTLTLDEPAKDGTVPDLRFAPPDGPDVAIDLTGEGTAWTGTLLLTNAMGKGNGRFILAVEDALSNPGTHITSGEYMEIYNTAFPDPTSPPSNLAAVTRSGGNVELNWDGVPGAESYRVYRISGECTQAPGEVAGEGITTNTFTDHPATDGKYCYGVKADLKGAESVLSGVASAVVDGTPPNPPENVSVALGDIGVRVAWEAPGTGEVAATYLVYRNGHLIRTVSGFIRSINDHPPAGGQYSYTVASVDWIGNEHLSSPVILNLNVGAVSNLEVFVRQGDVPHLGWDNLDPDVVGFNVYRGGLRLNTGLVAQTAFADNLYAGNSRVSYSVRAVNESGEESPPRIVDVYPLNIEVVTNPDAGGTGRPMVANYFNVLALSLLNREPGHDLTLDQVHLTLITEGADPFTLTKNVDWYINPGGSRREDLVVPVGDTTGAHELAIELRHSFEGGSSVVYEKLLSVTEIDRPGVTVDLSTTAVPLAGGYATVRLCINNHGYAEMDIVVSRGSTHGDLFVVVKNEDGLEIGRANFNGVPEGTRLSADKRAYLTVPGSGSSCVDVDVLVPETLETGDSVTFEGGVRDIYYYLGTGDEMLSGGLTAHMDSGISQSAYFGTASADKTVYVGDEPVIISGQALDRQTQSPVPEAALKLGFYSRGFKWFEEIVANDQGNFSYTYQPSHGMSGHFVVWAAHPAVFDTLNQAQFGLYRLYNSPEYGEIRMSKADSMSFQIELYNPGENPLTEFTSSFRAYTVDAEGVEIDEPTVTGQVVFSDDAFALQPGEKKPITLQLTADAGAPDAVNVEYDFQSAQNVTATFTGNVSLLQAIPILSVEAPHSGYVDLSLDRGTILSRPVTVKNIGLEALEGVEIIPPEEVAWMSLNLAKSETDKYLLGDIAAGASKTFDVVFAPPEDTTFGYHQDRIVLRGTNTATDYEIGLYGRVTSNKLGSVKFSVTNILDQELEGATIRLRNRAISEETEPVKTDLYGERLIADIQEGSWSWQVSAPGHRSETGVIHITADQTQIVEPLLSRSMVTINFKVEPVPYTDRYEIKLEQTFETHVPIPVLVVDPASKDFGTIRDGFEATYMVNVSNFGLKQMEDVVLATEETRNSRFEPLVKYLPVLAAMQTVQIPYRYSFNIQRSSLGEETTPQAASQNPPETLDSISVATGGFRTTASAVRTPLAERSFGDCLSDFVNPMEGIEAMEAIGAHIKARGYCANSTTPLAVGSGLMAFAAVTGGAENVIIGTAACLMNSVRQLIGKHFGGGGGGSDKKKSGGGGPVTGTSGGFARDPACFAAGTPITMWDGSTKLIEDISTGDRILSLHGTADRVRRVYSRQVDRVRELWIRSADGKETKRLVTTDEHLFRLAHQGWTVARQIGVGDEVILTGGYTGRVVRNDSVERRERVYNFEVDKYHAYFANGSLVYERCWNTDEDPFPKEATGQSQAVSQNYAIEVVKE